MIDVIGVAAVVKPTTEAPVLPSADAAEAAELVAALDALLLPRDPPLAEKERRYEAFAVRVG